MKSTLFNLRRISEKLISAKMFTMMSIILIIFSLHGTAQKPENMPVIQPLFAGALRDPSICIGPDGMYYLTGTSANNPAGGRDTTGWWFVNEGIRIWKSKDLKQWEPLGLIWSLDKDATWAKEFKTGRGAKRRALWAPEIHYIKGTFWLTYSMNYGGCGLLKSTTGKAEGPYKDVKTEGPLTNGRIDASLFQDDDGKVYFIYQNGLLAKMNDDMTGFAEEPRLLTPANNKQVGFEGAFLTKYKGKYILICAETNDNNGVRTYDCMSAVADNIYGPYGDRYLAIPHGGHNMIFKTNEGKWMSTFFGSDGTAIFSEKPAILPIEFSADCHFRPLMQTSAPANAQK
jgi:xylan 1,4-beta-xylosidase